MNTTPDPDLHQAFHAEIKRATKASHMEMEALPLSTALMRPGVTYQELANYLFAMQGIIAYAEKKIFPLVKSVVSDLGDRGKLGMIDLDILNFNISDRREFPFPGLAEPVSLARAMGFMYVMEGSTLGGRTIVKHLTRSAVTGSDGVFHFFSGYGDRTGAMWTKFLAALSAFAVTEKSSDEIINGAVETFTAIHDHFQKHSLINEN